MSDPSAASPPAFDDRIDVVLPTRDRRDALGVTLPVLLHVKGVSKIIVVDDGSRTPVEDLVVKLNVERVSVVRHEIGRGSPAARNTGVAASTAPWVLFAEDDCFLPSNYAMVLLAAAREHDADIVSAPWINPVGGRMLEVFPRLRSVLVDEIGIRSHPSSFPRGPIQTPFLPARALVRRNVFAKLAFDEGFTGNAYREETDFFVAACRLGFQCLLVPDTVSIQAGHWTGGQRRSRPLYELQAIRNNWKFLKKHGAWLKSSGLIRGRVGEQLWFTASRVRPLVRSAHRRAIRRVR